MTSHVKYVIASLGIAGLVLALTVPMAYSHYVGANIRPHVTALSGHDAGGLTDPHDPCGNAANPGRLHYVDTNVNQQHNHGPPGPGEPTICLP